MKIVDRGTIEIAYMLNSKNKKETLAGLKKSAGFLRSELAKRINLRNTPELVFELDESLEYGARIDKLLNDNIDFINLNNGINIFK